MWKRLKQLLQRKYPPSEQENRITETVLMGFMAFFIIIFSWLILNTLLFKYFINNYNPSLAGQFGDWLNGTIGTPVVFLNFLMFLAITIQLMYADHNRHIEGIKLNLYVKEMDIKYSEMVSFKEAMDRVLNLFHEVGGLNEQNILKLRSTTTNCISRLYLCFPEIKNDNDITLFIENIDNCLLSMIQKDGNEIIRFYEEINNSYIRILENIMKTVLNRN